MGDISCELGILREKLAFIHESTFSNIGDAAHLSPEALAGLGGFISSFVIEVEKMEKVYSEDAT